MSKVLSTRRFLFLGSIARFIISFYPLPTRHRVQQGDVNFSRDVRWSDTRAMDKIYSGIKNPRLTPVKHPHKRGATNQLVRPGLPDLLSKWSPGQSDVSAQRGHSPTVTSITRIPSSNHTGCGTRSMCRVSSGSQRKRKVAKRRFVQKTNNKL